jgi:hypothetical protein
MRYLLLTVVLLPTFAHADPPALRMSAEIDPADYTIYHGYGGFIGIHPAATPHWRFRIGGGAATMPSVVVENNDNNTGWKERIDPVVTLAAHYYLGHGRGGLFVGPVAGASSLTFTAPMGGKVDVRNVFAGFDVGYRWFPFESIGLVVTPHLGAIIPLYKSEEPTVGMESYDLLPVIPLPQLLVGYEFDVLK